MVKSECSLKFEDSYTISDIKKAVLLNALHHNIYNTTYVIKTDIIS